MNIILNCSWQLVIYDEINYSNTKKLQLNTNLNSIKFMYTNPIHVLLHSWLPLIAKSFLRLTLKKISVNICSCSSMFVEKIFKNDHLKLVVAYESSQEISRFWPQQKRSSAPSFTFILQNIGFSLLFKPGNLVESWSNVDWCCQ